MGSVEPQPNTFAKSSVCAKFRQPGLIIFDWDDTLFPTSSLGEEYAATVGRVLAEDGQIEALSTMQLSWLSQWDMEIEKLLHMLIKTGFEIKLCSNGCNDWLKWSVEQLPHTKSLLTRNNCLPETTRKFNALSFERKKYDAHRKILTNFYGSDKGTGLVIAVGDQNYDVFKLMEPSSAGKDTDSYGFLLTNKKNPIPNRNVLTLEDQLLEIQTICTAILQLVACKFNPGSHILAVHYQPTALDPRGTVGLIEVDIGLSEMREYMDTMETELRKEAMKLELKALLSSPRLALAPVVSPVEDTHQVEEIVCDIV